MYINHLITLRMRTRVIECPCKAMCPEERKRSQGLVRGTAVVEAWVYKTAEKRTTLPSVIISLSRGKEEELRLSTKYSSSRGIWVYKTAG